MQFASWSTSIAVQSCSRFCFVLLVLFISILFSCSAISTPKLTTEESRVAELYADYVSNQIFAGLCSKFSADNRYKVSFEKWRNKNDEDIASGEVILTHYYSSQDLNIYEVFKWKTDAEEVYFKEANEKEKSTICKRVADSFK